MSEVKRLEQELKEAKAKELKEKWEKYLDDLLTFCKALVGKVIISHTANGRFFMYKVSGYKEQYYIDRSGMYGQWGPERWIELESEGYLNFSVADDRGNWWRPSITNFDHNAHKFIFKKGTKVDIAKFDFTTDSISKYGFGDDSDRIYKLGYQEYNEYREDPSYNRALSNLFTFAQVMPDDTIYEEAKKIYLDHVQKVKTFWLTNEQKFKGLESMSSFYEKAIKKGS